MFFIQTTLAKLSVDFSGLFTALKNLNLAQPTWDIFVLFFFSFAVLLYGLTLGRDRIILTLIAIYMSLAVVNTAPYLSNFRNTGSEFALRMSLFVGAFIILFFALARSSFLRNIGSPAGGRWWQVILWSFLHVGLLTSVMLSFLPGTAMRYFAPFTQMVFTGNLGKFFWLVTPIALMIFIGEERRPKLQ
ncbi:hypothetical protein HYT45_03395 [Candidatus Uhrbacteria bacterium]|nr:hypothetical protein [Candidatus Uhrbacteria bacterium]